MRLVYFDCVGGAAGDMLLGALIDAGAPVAAVRDGLARLAVSGYRLDTSRTTVGAQAAMRLEVAVTEPQPHRTLPDILRILDPLPEVTRQRVTAVFRRLAEAEARVHGSTVDAVHFHEVGAVDAIVDIVGTVLALELLEVENVCFGLLEPGHGTVDTAHGLLPVPTPATLELLEGVPIRLGGEPGEWVTPTGAALLTTLGRPLVSGPVMRIEGSGVGCGSRTRRERPNIVRALVGEWGGEEASPAITGETPAVRLEQIVILETAIDDLTPEALAHAAEQLRRAGALDVLLTPVIMKKGRGGQSLQVLCQPAVAEELARVVLAETSTLGVRLRREERYVLQRRIRTVDTPYGPIRVKETVRPRGRMSGPTSASSADALPGSSADALPGSGADALPGSRADADAATDAAPEAADVAQAARAAGVAFQTVAAAALAAHRAHRAAGPARSEHPPEHL